MKLTLEAARVQSGLRQAAAANKVGIHPGTLSKYENGETSPTVDTAIELAKLYNMELEDIDWDRTHYE